ncbi:hypothetical protein [Rhizobium aegyptiacum]|uniref:hypothetical protein n=1 Tax=Rhizobium aegyptiacum TaxID=1764550 RepID=UPI000AB35839|nr:hypothetical protein [Rhizobium aegyptiacum]
MTYIYLRLPVALLAFACARPCAAGMASTGDRCRRFGQCRQYLNADAGASLSGRSGVDATAEASLGSTNGANADAAAYAGDRGVNADLNARVGGSDRVDADATASIGGVIGVNANLAIGRVNGRSDAAAMRAADAAEERTLDAFRSMPADQRREMLVRCADISGSGGSDSGLAGPCSPLQATVSR